jgi:hypothetical protein
VRINRRRTGLGETGWLQSQRVLHSFATQLVLHVSPSRLDMLIHERQDALLLVASFFVWRDHFLILRTAFFIGRREVLEPADVALKGLLLPPTVALKGLPPAPPPALNWNAPVAATGGLLPALKLKVAGGAAGVAEKLNGVGAAAGAAAAAAAPNWNGVFPPAAAAALLSAPLCNTTAHT